MKADIENVDEVDTEESAEESGDPKVWEQEINALDDSKLLDYICSIASARRQQIDADERLNAKPNKNKSNGIGYPVDYDPDME